MHIRDHLRHPGFAEFAFIPGELILCLFNCGIKIEGMPGYGERGIRMNLLV
jgi:hypothetical protein